MKLGRSFVIFLSQNKDTPKPSPAQNKKSVQYIYDGEGGPFCGAKWWKRYAPRKQKFLEFSVVLCGLNSHRIEKAFPIAFNLGGNAHSLQNLMKLHFQLGFGGIADKMEAKQIAERDGGAVMGRGCLRT